MRSVADLRGRRIRRRATIPGREKRSLRVLIVMTGKNDLLDHNYWRNQLGIPHAHVLDPIRQGLPPRGDQRESGVLNRYGRKKSRSSRA
jgi:hypothetical protein